MNEGPRETPEQPHGDTRIQEVKESKQCQQCHVWQADFIWESKYLKLK